MLVRFSRGGPVGGKSGSECTSTGGDDECPSITKGLEWASNIRTERDSNFQTRPNPYLNGRIDSLAAGRVLGGGSSINAMASARGHKSDWDYFAQEEGDPAWNWDSVLKLYRELEDWQAAPDPDYPRHGRPALSET